VRKATESVLCSEPEQNIWTHETLASFMTHLWFLSLTTGGQELIGVSFVMLELQSKFVTYGRMLV
jgi:hypothetical protein